MVRVEIKGSGWKSKKNETWILWNQNLFSGVFEVADSGGKVRFLITVFEKNWETVLFTFNSYYPRSANPAMRLVNVLETGRGTFTKFEKILSNNEINRIFDSIRFEFSIWIIFRETWKTELNFWPCLVNAPDVKWVKTQFYLILSKKVLLLFSQKWHFSRTNNFIIIYPRHFKISSGKIHAKIKSYLSEPYVQ